MRQVGVSERDGQEMKNSGKGKTSESGVEAARKTKWKKKKERQNGAHSWGGKSQEE